MKISQKKLVILHIHNNQANWIPIAKQTQNIRNDTNLQIKELGEKYYNVKQLFEKMNFHRDNLFFFGKQVEEKMKELKNMTHLKTQSKRMKEALYCWYAENFYLEIFEKNSSFLKQMVEFEKSKNRTDLK